MARTFRNIRIKEFKDNYMNTEPSITNIDDEKLVYHISRAKNRIVYMSPGISDQVAHALSIAWMRLGNQAVYVILDVDPEVCRLGYGTLEGIKTILDQATKLGAQVFQQPGVRIGLLIADKTTIVYSPTPLLIEAGSKQPERPNAIQLSSPPNEITEEIGLGCSDQVEQLIGKREIELKDIQKTEYDLKTNPPVKFDLARKVRVFISKFQFVEFEMSGCYISRKKVPISSDLVGLAKETNLQKQFHAHFDLISQNSLEVKNGNRTLTEASMRKKKEEISKRFLISLKGYGSVLLRVNKDDFLKAVKDLEADVNSFKQGVVCDLQKHMDQNAESLVDALLPAVIQNPPEEYTKFFGVEISKDQLKENLKRDIKKSFGNAQNLIQDMIVKVLFKDLTYESLNDAKFLKVAREAIPGNDVFHEEYDAAKAAEE